MGWAIGNVVGTAAGFFLGGYAGMVLGSPSFWLGGILLAYSLAVAGAMVGGLAGGLIGVGTCRAFGASGEVVPWGRAALNALGTFAGCFAGFAAGAGIKSLFFEDGPDGFWLFPLGAGFGGVLGGLGLGTLAKGPRP